MRKFLTRILPLAAAALLFLANAGLSAYGSFAAVDPSEFIPPSGALARVLSPEDVLPELRSVLEALTPEQLQSGETMSAVAFFAENLIRRGTTRNLPDTTTLTSDILSELSELAWELRQQVSEVFAEYNIELMRDLRANINISTDGGQELIANFPDVLPETDFANLTFETDFASFTINREHIVPSGAVHLSVLSSGTHGFFARLFDLSFWHFWSIWVVLLVIVAAILIHRAGNHLRAWITPAICVLIIGINLWTAVSSMEAAEIIPREITVDMTDGKRVTVSLPLVAVYNGNVLLNEQGEPQLTRMNFTADTLDARIRESGIYAPGWASGNFDDIDGTDSETFLSIRRLASMNVMRGTTYGFFYPDSPISRADFAAAIVMVFDMLNLDATSSFRDVSPGDWYFRAIATAELEGLAEGFPDGTFRGNIAIPKEQMVVIAASVLERQMGYNIPQNPADILQTFQDRRDIPRWAAGSAALCIEAGVLPYRRNGLFAPQSTMTRADAAVVLYRLFNRAW